MLKSIAAVILGYIAMAAIVFSTLTGSYLLLGPDRVFHPGTYDVTAFWIILMIVFSVVSAIVGGWVCLKIAKKHSAVVGLAVLALVLGVISAFFSGPVSAAARTGDVPNLQAMMNSKEPAWFAWLLPVIGFSGVLIGGKSSQR